MFTLCCAKSKNIPLVVVWGGGDDSLLCPVTEMISLAARSTRVFVQWLVDCKLAELTSLPDCWCSLWALDGDKRLVDISSTKQQDIVGSPAAKYKSL